MNITELLVTGFDGSEPIFAVTLTQGDATTVITVANEDGEAAVNAVVQRETDVFASIRELLDGLVCDPG